MSFRVPRDVGSLFLAPLAGTVPPFATVPALILVAVLMAKALADIDWDDLTESAPAFICAISMPLTFSIAHGIAFGFVSYAVIKLLAGRAGEAPLTAWVLAAVFVAKFGWLKGAGYRRAPRLRRRSTPGRPAVIT